MAAFNIAQIIATMRGGERGVDLSSPEWREKVHHVLEIDYPGLWEALSSPQRQAWRYVVPGSSLKEVLVAGDALGCDALALARVSSHVCAIVEDAETAEWIRWRAATERAGNLDVTVRGNAEWPYEKGRFDLAVLSDLGRDWGWQAEANATLREIHRLLAVGGYFYVTADNKIRWRSQGLSLASARRSLDRIGFRETRWFAAFPSATLPRHLADLRGGVMDYYVSAYLNLDHRWGPMIRRANRLACRLGVAPYLVPGYALVGRKGSE